MSARKKHRGRKARNSPLTHFDVRRGSALRLRIAIADDALAEAGDELGALLRKIAPSAISTSTIPCAIPAGAIADTSSEIIIAPEHTNDDDAYHAVLRDRLAELISSLCDSSLADALEIAREERARRADGGN